MLNLEVQPDCKSPKCNFPMTSGSGPCREARPDIISSFILFLWLLRADYIGLRPRAGPRGDGELESLLVKLLRTPAPNLNCYRYDHNLRVRTLAAADPGRDCKSVTKIAVHLVHYCAAGSLKRPGPGTRPDHWRPRADSDTKAGRLRIQVCDVATDHGHGYCTVF